ncbi:lysine transporter LysE [Limnohabitans sp. T6-5]|uniref:LysE family translocator n=1 Tax=Limnohabitans sp. T6-5 TaxID=1100724 RepID=UPI000D3A3707|nr:LysE family translocator [Limnohabitans sp. T6-5]PUE06426.1 lysine transporter LysE [Limnohabitans sp. T6-5]
MITVEHLGLFIAAGVVLNLTPGPDVLYIVSQALRGGVRPGLVAALGITAGCFVHMTAAAIGVGAMLAASVATFNVLKWAGAAYLVWVGVRLLYKRASAERTPRLLANRDLTTVMLRSVFFRGFLTNVLNPKVALFFLAFVPQFIPAHAAAPALTFVVLGCLFNINGMLICMAWALAASWLAQHARVVQQGMHCLDRVAGVLFVGFGLKLAWADAPVH